MSSPILVCPDQSFGPWAGARCRGGFDLTILFEEVILSIPIQCIFLFAVGIRIKQLYGDDVKCRPGILAVLKLIASLVLLCLSIAALALPSSTARSDLSYTTAALPTLILSITTALVVCIASWIEHRRCLRPSFVLTMFLGFSALLDIPRMRTLWMMDSSSTAQATILTSNVVLRGLMFVLESMEKRHLLRPRYRASSTESTQGTVTHALFLWLIPLFMKGYGSDLRHEDFAEFDKALSSEFLLEKFEAVWQKVTKKDVPGALCASWIRAFGRSLWTPVLPKLVEIAFIYTQPFLVETAITISAAPSGQPYDNMSCGLVGAFALVYIGIALSTGQYAWQNARATSVLRGSVIAFIYNDCFSADVLCCDVDPAATITLIGTDVEVIAAGLHHLHELWSSIVEIAIADYLLYKQLGVACAVPITSALVLLVGSVFLAIPMGKAQAAWVQASQDRITATSRTLTEMKWIRAAGLSEEAFARLDSRRLHELNVSSRFRKLLGFGLLLLELNTLWTPILTFCIAAALDAGGKLQFSVSKVFTAFSIMMLLSKPVMTLMVALPSVASAVASFQRIQSHIIRTRRISSKSVKSGDWQSDRPITNTNNEQHTMANMYELMGTSSVGSHRENLPPKGHIAASVQGSCAWTKDSEPIFDIDEFVICHSTLNLVLGPPGCGKSALLQVLLGELPMTNGTLCKNYSAAAYCDQTPWLPNEAIRDIVIGSTIWDEVWFRTVIRACALEHDISQWPDRENTMAGSGGCALSGGQKQRLSLARALYSREGVMILDDTFSALDDETATKIACNLFGKDGLLRSMKTTVVYAGSDDRLLDYSDAAFLLHDKKLMPYKQATRNGLTSNSLPKIQKVTHSINTKAMLSLQGEALYAGGPATGFGPNSKRRLGDLDMYRLYTRAAGWPSVLLFSFAIGAYAFGASFPAVWLGWWANAIERNSHESSAKWLSIYALLGVCSLAAAGFGIWILLIVVVKKAGLSFHHLLIETFNGAPTSFHASTDVSITLNRFSQDLQLIDMELPIAAFGMTITLAFALAHFAITASQVKYMAACLPVLGLAFYSLQHFYLRTSRQLRLLEIEYKAPVYQNLAETLNGLITIRAFRWEGKYRGKGLVATDNFRKPSYLLACVQCWLIFTSSCAIMVIAVVFMAIASQLRDQSGPSTMGTGLSAILAFSGAAQGLITFWVVLEVSLGAVARVNDFITTTPQERGMSTMMLRGNEQIWPSRGAIQLLNVTASYSSSRRCLDNVTLSISPGQKVAVCGRTGSGKSTLALCLLKMLDLDAGSIIIDDVDISTLAPELVRRSLISLPQQPFILDGSIRANVDPQNHALEEDIVQVLKTVRLWDKITARGGLDAHLHERFFSIGEFQVLVFARAMLRKSNVIVLDEFTSSLDNETRCLLESLLHSWFIGVTMIVIAHRLDNFLAFDRVAVFSDGKLLDYDHPDRLCRNYGALDDPLGILN